MSNTEAYQCKTNKEESEWKRVPVEYHLETVGIGDVFLSSSSEDNVKQIHGSDTILTLEISGTIKSCPQDFIVREVGGLCFTKKEYTSMGINSGDNVCNKVKVANLNDTTNANEGMDLVNKTISPSPMKRKKNDDRKENEDDSTSVPTIKKRKIDNTEVQEVHEIINATNESELNSPIHARGENNDNKEMHTSTHNVLSPMEAIQYILSKCNQSSNTGINSSKDKASYLFECIQKLNEEALNDIIALSTNDTEEDNYSSSNLLDNGKSACIHVIVPPIVEDVQVDIMNTTSSKNNNDNGNNRIKFESRNRAILHRSLRTEFPLLSSQTIKQSQIIEEEAKGNANELSGHCVKITKDKTFHAIIPFLSHVHDDLIDLYTFYKRGCFVSNDSPNRRRSARKIRKKMRSQSIVSDNDTDVDNNEERQSSNSLPSQILLRLKPGLGKEKRRGIHHLIANICRDFETSTINNYEFQECGVNKSTSAITVFWSHRAQMKIVNSMKHREKKCIDGIKSNEHLNNTLCVLKKTNQEHLSAINRLVTALRCTQSDIGLAGIKDMCAVTYQFCTIRNTTPQHAHRANAKLKENSIELGNFERVNWTLTKGMLHGNQFEITIRDIKRVEIRSSKANNMEERFVDCQFSHIDKMVAKVKKIGFINFFGVQRVGDAGPNEVIGVRPFDIGRELLKKNYTKVIDLLMTGRNTEGPKTRQIRQIWKETEGDHIATLEGFQQGNVMIRERTVLQGLKRYGKDNPLEALKCLPYSIRIFWINAFQSYVWNKMATERLRYGGKIPLVGDLYFSSGEIDEVKVVADPSSVVLEQIVLPLPGHNVQYPSNFVGDRYKQFLEQEGIIFRKEGEFSAKGSYRFLIAKPTYIEWQPITERKGENDQNTVTTALFKFSLPSGSYATQGLLRELMATKLGRRTNITNM